MKKNTILGVALAMVILSAGAVSASASGSEATSMALNCADKQADQQFSKETAGLASSLKAKSIELQGEYGYRGGEGYNGKVDVGKINSLEAQIETLKNKINAAAQKYDIPVCNRS